MQVKELKNSLVCEMYSGLLTRKQYDVMDMYYNLDYSLTEIAENIGVSRQGVLGILKRTEMKLNEYEQKLGLLNKYTVTLDSLKKIEQSAQDNELILKEVKKIREAWED